MTPRGCWSTGGGGVGGRRSRGRQRRGPAALRLPGELGDDSIFCVLDVAGVSGAPQDRPTVSREPAGARRAALLGVAGSTAPRGQESRDVRAEARRLHPPVLPGELMPQSRQPGVPVSAHRLGTEVLQALAHRAGEGIGEGRVRGEIRLERWGVEKKRCKQIRQEEGTKGCPPSVTLRDKGPRTPHTCSHSGLRWGGDPNFLT